VLHECRPPGHRVRASSSHHRSAPGRVAAHQLNSSCFRHIKQLREFMINDLFPREGSSVLLKNRELIRTDTIDCMRAVSKKTQLNVDQLYATRTAAGVLSAHTHTHAQQSHQSCDGLDGV